MNTGWLVDSFTEMGNRINVSPSASVLKTDKLKEAFYYSLKNIECTKKVIGNDLAINYFIYLIVARFTIQRNHLLFVVRGKTL